MLAINLLHTTETRATMKMNLLLSRTRRRSSWNCFTFVCASISSSNSLSSRKSANKLVHKCQVRATTTEHRRTTNASQSPGSARNSLMMRVILLVATTTTTTSVSCLVCCPHNQVTAHLSSERGDVIRGDAFVLLLVNVAPALPLAAIAAACVVWKGLVCGLRAGERAVCAPLECRGLLLLLLLLLPDHFLALFGAEEVGDNGGSDARAFALWKENRISIVRHC